MQMIKKKMLENKKKMLVIKKTIGEMVIKRKRVAVD